MRSHGGAPFTPRERSLLVVVGAIVVLALVALLVVGDLKAWGVLP